MSTGSAIENKSSQVKIAVIPFWGDKQFFVVVTFLTGPRIICKIFVKYRLMNRFVSSEAFYTMKIL